MICFFILSIFLLNNKAYSQAPAIVSFPVATEAVTACNGASLVIVQVDFTSNAAGATEAIVNLQLGQEMEYVAGSILKTSGAAGLLIGDDGGTINAPQFKITGSVATSDRITFSIEQQGNCDAKIASLNNSVFETVATVAVNGVSTNPKISPSFSVDYPELTFTQPSPQNNAVLNTQYTRTFTITNGAEGCANAIHFTIERENASTELVSLSLAGNPITPTSVVGNIEYYTVSGAILTADEQLCNGESLVFTEVYIFKSCLSSTNTNYTVGWGCDADPANWCETSSGIGTISTALGVGEFKNGDLTNQKIGYVDMCNPFTVRSSYKNSGSGNASAGGLYDLSVLRGSYSSGNTLRGFPGFVNITNVTINGLAVPFSFSATNQLVIHIKNHFTSDPDGTGGLADLDGDGFFDDLPVGAELVTEFTWTFNCSFPNGCGVATDDLNMYKVGAILEYHEKCDPTAISTDVVASSGVLGFGYIQLNANGSAPANIVGGTAFRVRLSAAYFNILNDFQIPSSRYAYEITLPPGLSVAGTGNPTWTAGEFGGSGSTAGVTYSQIGNVVTITSPNNGFGYANIDLVYTCGSGGSLDIPYRLNQINSSSCDCLKELTCSTLTVNADCSSTCASGPSVGIPVVRRAEKSLGWTNRNMTTKQLATNINAYDLSKALYLDEIEIHNTVVQRGAAADFYVRLELPKAGTQNKLQPIGVDVVIRRGATDLVTTTVTAFSMAESTSSDQKIDFNLTSILPSGGLMNGDVLLLIAKYQVRINSGLPLYDVQSGGDWYCYNLSGTTKVSCNNYVPEMYLVGTSKLNGSNSFIVDACNPAILGYNTNYIARRFNTSGLKYTNEFRPALYITSMEVTMPAGYDFVNSEFRLQGGSYGGVNPLDITITPSSIVGNVLTFVNPGIGAMGEWGALEISVTNTYGAYLPFTVEASCLTQTYEPIKFKVNVIDYYYHAAEFLPTIPSSFDSDLPLNRNIELRNKAAISIQNQTGNIQSSSLSESFEVRLQSTGLSTAPYNWIAIEDVLGVTIQQVYDISNGTFIPSTPYAGGKIYYLSQTGIPSGNSKDYRIDFTYTTCVSTDIQVQGGWNCSEYPTDPSSYPCGAAVANLTFTPQLGGVEIIPVTETVSNVSLCNSIPFEYRINSTRAGNTLSNSYTVITTTGISPVAGSFEIEFPAGSGNWESVTETVSGINYTVDLTTHANYPSSGINGTLNDGGDPNTRLIGVRYNMITNCNFVVGSSFSMVTNANSLCGDLASGSGKRAYTPGINIDGANADYQVDLDLSTVNGSFNNCGGPITLKGFYEITSSGPVTGNNSYLLISLPVGYNYTPNSYAATGANQAAYNSVSTTSNGEVVRLDVPAGMVSGSTLNYTIEITESTAVYAVCGNKTIEVSAIDDIANVPCASENSGFCPAINIEVAKYNLNFSVEKASASINSDITVSTMNGSNEEIETFFTVKNDHPTFNIASGTVVGAYYDANQNGVVDGADVLLGSQTMLANIFAGNIVSDSISFTANPNQVCSILLVVSRNKNTCLCSGGLIKMDIPTMVKGIAGIDQPVCSTNDSEKIGFPNNPGYSYSWQGSTAAETGYLDNPSLSDPTFNYTGPAISSPTTISYVLTVTRNGGCISKDTVLVNLEPSLGTSITITTPGYNTMPCPGDNVTMISPTFTGGTYQWFKDGVEDVSATTNQYNFPDLQQTNSAYYTSIVTVGKCKVAGGLLIDPSVCGGPLAVKLTSFNSNCEPDGGVSFRWVTGSETNSLNFTLKKSSDLINWEIVDVLPAKGNSSIENSYVSLDRYPYAGISYYQLTQRDIDGLEKVYPPMSSNCKSIVEKEFKIYPNPTKRDFKVEFYTDSETIYNLQVMDINGRVFISQTHKLEKGKNTLLISENLVKGLYIIRITDDTNGSKTAKLVIN